MLNPHLIDALRRAEVEFARRGQPVLARSAYNLRGEMADSIDPIEAEALATHLLGLCNV